MKTNRYVKVIIWVFITVLLTGCPQQIGTYGLSEIAVEGVYVHRYSNMKFPETVGPFERVNITNYSEPNEDNIGVGYNYNSEYTPIIATVYIYPAPPVYSIGSPPEVTQGVREKLFEDYYKNIILSISSQHEDVILLTDEDFTLEQSSFLLKGKKAVFNLKENFAGSKQNMVSEFYLFQHGQWLLKYRISYPWAVQNQTQELITDFMISLKIPSDITDKG